MNFCLRSIFGLKSNGFRAQTRAQILTFCTKIVETIIHCRGELNCLGNTLSMGSLKCSRCLKYFVCLQNGFCAGDKTVSLYQGCIKNNTTGCCGHCNNSSAMKDVKKLVEAMWKWLQRVVLG